MEERPVMQQSDLDSADLLQELRSSWQEFRETTNVFEEKLENESVQKRSISSKPPQDYVPPDQRVADYNQRQEMLRSSQLEQQQLKQERIKASAPKISLNSLKCIVEQKRYEILDAVRGVLTYETELSREGSQMTRVQLFEVLCSLNYVSSSNGQDQEFVQGKIARLISGGQELIDLSDLQQFLLALEFLEFRSIPDKDPRKAYLVSQGLLQWFSKAEQARQLKHNRLTQPAQQRGIREDRAARLGFTSELDSCPFKPAITVNEEMAQRGASRILEKMEKAGLNPTKSGPMYENAVRLEELRRSALNSTKQMEDENCTFIPTISKRAARIKTTEDVVTRMSQNVQKLRESQEKRQQEKLQLEAEEERKAREARPTIRGFDKSALQASKLHTGEQGQLQAFKERMARARAEREAQEQRYQNLGLVCSQVSGPISKSQQQSALRLTQAGSQKQKKEALLVLEVLIRPGKTARVVVYEGDTPESIASSFQRIHSLSQEKARALLSYVQGAFLENSVAFPTRVSSQNSLGTPNAVGTTLENPAEEAEFPAPRDAIPRPTSRRIDLSAVLSSPRAQVGSKVAEMRETRPLSVGELGEQATLLAKPQQAWKKGEKEPFSLGFSASEDDFAPPKRKTAPQNPVWRFDPDQ